MKDLRNVRYLITHSGKFHADDVFATALLTMINHQNVTMQKYYPFYVDPTSGKILLGDNDELVIFRTVDVEPEWHDHQHYVIYDIGHGQYDHHQISSEIRENGIKYAAFGLLFRDTWQYLFDDKEDADRFEQNIVQMIDETDNTGKPNYISAYINTFMPSWDEDNSTYDINVSFCKAVTFAYHYIEGFVRKANSTVKAEVVCEKSEVIDKRILVLDEYVPHNRWAYRHGIWCAVFPSLRGGWSSSVISDPDGNNIALFPSEWRGATKESLYENSKIETLKFCHKSGFMVSCDTKEDAIKASNYAHPINLTC